MNSLAWKDGDEIRVRIDGSSRDRFGMFVEYGVCAVWNGGPYIDLFELDDWIDGPFDTICVWSSETDRAVIAYDTKTMEWFMRGWMARLIKSKEEEGW